jgi:hypothetical protein
MKKALLVLLIFILAACSNSNSDNPRIAACPTMHNLLGSNSILTVESSGKGFVEVRNGNHDFVVTGRPPAPVEKAGLQTITIIEGHTIISSINANAFLSELRTLRISGCVDNIQTSNFLLLPCDTYPARNSLKLINWSDWKGEPFVTVFDDNTGFKSMDFRGVYLTGRAEGKDIAEAEKIVRGHLE